MVEDTANFDGFTLPSPDEARAQTAPAVITDPKYDPIQIPRFIDKFEICRQIGNGGFGVVFLAIDPDLKKERAIKLPIPGIRRTSTTARQSTPYATKRLRRRASRTTTSSRYIILLARRAFRHGPMTPRSS